MRYRLLLVVKLITVTCLLACLWVALATSLPFAPPVPPLMAFTHVSWKLPWTLTVGAFVVLGCGLVFVCLLDQRYRCRVCCRRLRMPVANGSWSHSLTDRPSTEYICIYGHGKLSVPGASLTGFEASRWTFYDDIWKELFRNRPVAPSP